MSRSSARAQRATFNAAVTLLPTAKTLVVKKQNRMHDSGLGLSAIYDGLRILHTYIVWIATTSISEMAMMAAAVRWLGMKSWCRRVYNTSTLAPWILVLYSVPP